MTKAPIRFKTKPSLAIRLVLNRLVLKTIVFGAVATGSINAQLALIAAGTINKAGSMPVAIAAAARIGIIKLVVAVLLVISVRKVMVRQMVANISKICQLAIPESAVPSASLRPETTKPLAIAIPPPNNISMPQGIRPAVSQSSSFEPLPSLMRNIATTATSATLASLALLTTTPESDTY